MVLTEQNKKKHCTMQKKKEEKLLFKKERTKCKKWSRQHNRNV